MSISLSCTNQPYTIKSVMAGLSSCGTVVKDGLNATSKKITDVLRTPVAKGVIGFGLGLCAYKVYSPITQKILQTLSRVTTASFADPSKGLSLTTKFILAPFTCILGPIVEEVLFRGDLQGYLKNAFQSFYINRGISESKAVIAARVTSVFFTSVIFGLVHFSNALFLWSNPMIFLPQVVACTIMGFMFGAAKELSGGLSMPIGMHMGNNTIAMAHSMGFFV
jgi:membrane protease YdiL (CAAX protease family)